jgi:hypothetical protein
MPLLLRVASVVSLCFVMISGCEFSSPKRNAVTGQVKYKGEPITDGVITFIPDDPALKATGGSTIKDGKFEIRKNVGLPAGQYKVSINYPDPKRRVPIQEGDAPGESREVPDLLPPKYNRETILRAEIKSDAPNELTFDLD